MAFLNILCPTTVLDLPAMNYFTERNGIKHTFTSPSHPSSNGLAERAVQTMKSGISKMEENIKDRIYCFLLITPHPTTGLSPAEL